MLVSYPNEHAPRTMQEMNGCAFLPDNALFLLCLTDVRASFVVFQLWVCDET